MAFGVPILPQSTQRFVERVKMSLLKGMTSPSRVYFTFKNLILILKGKLSGVVLLIVVYPKLCGKTLILIP
jgi:hypothetical protein